MQHMHVYEECGWTRWIGSVLSLKRLRHLWDSLSTLWSGSYLHRMPLIPDMFYCMTDFDLTLSIYCMTKRWPLPWNFARSDTEHSFPFTLPPSLFHCWAFSLLPSPSFFTFFSFMLLLFGCCLPWAVVVFLWRDKASFTVVSAITTAHSNTDDSSKISPSLVMFQIKSSHESPSAEFTSHLVVQP